MTGSVLELLFAAQIAQAKLPAPIHELRFDPERRWRFDYGWPEYELALEIEGGLWVKGRHMRPAGAERDMEKYNAAALAGWRVLRVSGAMVEDGRAIALVRLALSSTG